MKHFYRLFFTACLVAPVQAQFLNPARGLNQVTGKSIVVVDTTGSPAAAFSSRDR